MSKTNTFEAEILGLIFNNNNIALIGDATGVRGSTTVGSLWVSLHAADPGEAPATGQTTSEVSYTGYGRVGVARTSGAWTITGTAPTQVAPVSAITFGMRTDVGTATATHFAIGTDQTGNGKILYKGAITPNITITQNVTPQLTTATTVTED